jgi:hypothetical protein
MFLIAVITERKAIGVIGSDKAVVPHRLLLVAGDVGENPRVAIGDRHQ